MVPEKHSFQRGTNGDGTRLRHPRITDSRCFVNSVVMTYSTVIPEIAATSVPGNGTNPNRPANGKNGIVNVTTMSPIVEIKRTFPGRL